MRCRPVSRDPIYPVNRKGGSLHGLPVFPDIASLPAAPDLAVIATPPDSVPCADRRTRRARHPRRRGDHRRVRRGRSLDRQGPRRAPAGRSAAASAAHRRAELPRHARAGIGLNASFAPAAPLPGNIAFVTQSGAHGDHGAGLGAAARHRLFRHRLAGRHGRCRFRRHARLSRARRPATHAILLYVEAVDACAQIHVGGARGGAHQAGDRGQGRPRRRRRARPPRRIPARSPAPTPSTTPRSAAPACCASTSWTSCSTRSRRWRACRRSAATALAILTNGGGAGVLATDALIE